MKLNFPSGVNCYHAINGQTFVPDAEGCTEVPDSAVVLIGWMKKAGFTEVEQEATSEIQEQSEEVQGDGEDKNGSPSSPELVSKKGEAEESSGDDSQSTTNETSGGTE